MLRNQGRSWWQSTQGGDMATRPVGWHENLYYMMAVQIYDGAEWAKGQAIKEMSCALVLGRLTRTLGRLTTFQPQLVAA